MTARGAGSTARRTGWRGLVRAARLVLAGTLLTTGGASAARAQWLLVPMDEAQQNHLKAYGLTYRALKDGEGAEWLLNWRGGAFLLKDAPARRRAALLAGVSTEPVSDAQVAEIRRQLAGGNYDAVQLERVPRVAVYTPPGSPPWDDAVTLALTYAGIEYTKVWDDEVLAGDLGKVDWLHLFHEDFTGQLNKLHLGFRDAPWYVESRERNLAAARRAGLGDVPALKKAVSERIREFVERGGFLFAMCGATESLELALAARGVDIAGAFADGSPADPDADARLDWGRTFAAKGVHVEPSPYVNALSDLDGHQVNVPNRRQPLGAFRLFDFAAKFDPVAAMLVQSHRAELPDFYGVTTSFVRGLLKPGVTILASEERAPWAKYLHGDFGKGSWTYLGGHDPEDPQHNIGSPPTDLALHPNSPGYRLILNNVLFPAAKKKPLKTE